MRLLGALLAGGASRRFGRDKAAALLAGRPLLDHVAAGLQPQVDQLVVCGRSWPGLESLSDRPEPALGPLGGLCAALEYAREAGFEAVLSSGCDVLPVPDLRMLAGKGASVMDGQYLFGFWPVQLASQLHAHLVHGTDRSMRGWMQACGARRVACAAPLHNLNTEADFLLYRDGLGETA